MKIDLTGKVALVTASTGGIGFAIARGLAESGAEVIVNGRSVDSVNKGIQALQQVVPGVQVRAAIADLSSQEGVDELLRVATHVDILVNNAGITQPLKLMDIKRDNYDAVLDVSLRGTLLMSQAVIPTLRAQKSGSIVCISSVSAQRGGGIFGGPHYSAAKAGVLGLAKAMARELGPDNVRVNCITPGLIQTDITAGKLSDEMKTAILAGIPLNRLGDAQDVARAALFLGSDLSSYSTGITLDVNGGMLIH